MRACVRGEIEGCEGMEGWASKKDFSPWYQDCNLRPKHRFKDAKDVQEEEAEDASQYAAGDDAATHQDAVVWK